MRLVQPSTTGADTISLSFLSQPSTLLGDFLWKQLYKSFTFVDCSDSCLGNSKDAINT